VDGPQSPQAFSEYGISDPMPRRFPSRSTDWRMTAAELPEYFAWIDRARAHAAGRLPIPAPVWSAIGWPGANRGSPI